MSSISFLLISQLQLILELVILLLLATLWRRSTSSLVQLSNDGLHNVFHLLLLCFEIFSRSILILLQPGDLLVDHLLDLALLVVAQLATQLLLVRELILQTVSITFKFIPGLDLSLQSCVLISELLSIVDHSLDVFWGQSVLVIGDSDLLLRASALVLGTHDEDTVGVNLEGNLNLRNASGCWRNSCDVKLAQLPGVSLF